MSEKLIRVGTTYVPVQNVEKSAEWYVSKLGAQLNYKDDDKAIVALADHALFLVRSKEGQTANFIDAEGKEQFSVTFEVDGEQALEALRRELSEQNVEVGEVEDRGHPGLNFTFTDPDGNKFDVWSRLSPAYKAMKG